MGADPHTERKSDAPGRDSPLVDIARAARVRCRPVRPRRGRLRLGPLLVAASTAGVLLGCGSDDPSSSSPTTASATTTAAADSATPTTTGAAPSETGAAGGILDPCSLITSADASAIVGAAVGDGLVTPFPAGTACIYQGGQSIVGVQVYSAPGTPELLAANAPLFAPDAAPIQGVGEAAYLSATEASIGVLQDGVIFSVTLVVEGQPGSRDAVLAAAEVALGNLP